MKITKRQLRSIIRESLMEGYNSMSSASKARANAVKRNFVKLYPDAKVGIDGRDGWITVNDKKAINMSQASGSPLTDEEMIDKMHAVYAGESVDPDVSTAMSSNDTYRMNEQAEIPEVEVTDGGGTLIISSEAAADIEAVINQAFDVINDLVEAIETGGYPRSSRQIVVDPRLKGLKEQLDVAVEGLYEAQMYANHIIAGTGG